MVFFLRDKNGEKEIVEAQELNEEKIEALSDETRRKILKIISKKPSYPAEIASKLGIGKQQAYYHFKKLKSANILEEHHEERLSGGVATFYAPRTNGFVKDLESGGEKIFIPDKSSQIKNFLSPFIKDGKIKGNIVVGSPDQHGEDQVRARDGHLAGEISKILGHYGKTDKTITRLDTDIIREQDFEKNMILLGGILTNTVSKKFNKHFPANFATEEFPYHELNTPKDSYQEDSVGLISKIPNPEKENKSIYIIAGIRNRGTKAAIEAFNNLEKVLKDYRENKEFYRVVKGLDIDGDGEIDDFEVLE